MGEWIARLADGRRGESPEPGAGARQNVLHGVEASSVMGVVAVGFLSVDVVEGFLVEITSPQGDPAMSRWATLLAGWACLRKGSRCECRTSTTGFPLIAASRGTQRRGVPARP